MVAVAISTVTDPIGAAAVAAVTITGTTNVGTNTVSVTIVDEAGATVGPSAATVVGTSWSLTAPNVSALADGTLIVEATATDLASAKAFAAKATTKATAARDYITAAEFRDYIKDPSSLDPDAIAAAISTASRAVDAHCGRFFYQLATVMKASPSDAFVLYIDDLATTAGLAVAVDWGTAGTYPETRTVNVDFICEPVNQNVGGIGGRPFTSLRSLNGKIWPPRIPGFFRDTVRITGTFGWPAVPDPVRQATKVLAAMYFSLAGTPLGYSAIPDGGGAIRVRENPIASTLLVPYCKGDSLLMA